MSIVTVFKVVELNRCTTLNSVGGLLDLALEIESYNVNRNSIEFNFTYSLNTPTNLSLCLEGDSLTDCLGLLYIHLSISFLSFSNSYLTFTRKMARAFQAILLHEHDSFGVPAPLKLKPTWLQICHLLSKARGCIPAARDTAPPSATGRSTKPAPDSSCHPQGVCCQARTRTVRLLNKNESVKLRQQEVNLGNAERKHKHILK